MWKSIAHFIKALEDDEEGMYRERKEIWYENFRAKYWVSWSAITRHMPMRKRVYPTKDEIKVMRANQMTDLQIMIIHNLTQNQLKVLSEKEPHAKLTPVQKKEIRESDDTPENLMRRYNVTRTTIDHIRWYSVKIEPRERILNKGKWDRSEPKPYWENVWEIKSTLWPAKFIQFNTPLWITTDDSQSK